MDFGHAHVIEESVASRSGIRYISKEEGLALNKRSTSHDETDDQKPLANNETSPHSPPPQTSNENKDEEDKRLDEMALNAANHAAISLLVPKYAISRPSSPTKDGGKGATTVSTSVPHSMIDASLYKHRCLPRQSTIQVGDLVVIMISFDTLNFVYAKRNAIFSNRNGHFHHNDFLGKPFGCKVRSRTHQGYGFCYLLKPTPELWVRSLPHRTQIVHELDQAQIIFQLQIRPNSIVVESGTGSAALSHALVRSIAPRGHLHTYEFNPHRAQTARDELARHGLSHLVTVRNVDVCSKSTSSNCPPETNPKDSSQPTPTVPGGGFVGVAAHSVDAVFLDLPEPWNAIAEAARVLKPNGRIANYSPCIEQTQRAVAALEEAGFHSIQTMEFRLMQHYVDKITYAPAPRHLKRPCLVDATYNAAEAAAASASAAGTQTLPESNNNNKKTGKSKKRKNQEGDTPDATGEMSKKAKAETEEPLQEEQNDAEPSASKPRGKTMIVARPFGLIRGHTAFLTFATAGLVCSKPHAAAAVTKP